MPARRNMASARSSPSAICAAIAKPESAATMRPASRSFLARRMRSPASSRGAAVATAPSTAIAAAVLSQRASEGVKAVAPRTVPAHLGGVEAARAAAVVIVAREHAVATVEKGLELVGVAARGIDGREQHGTGGGGGIGAAIFLQQLHGF